MCIMRKPSVLMKTFTYAAHRALLSQVCAYAALILSLCLIISLICVCISTTSHSKELDHITLMWRHTDYLLPHSCAILKNSPMAYFSSTNFQFKKTCCMLMVLTSI